MVVTKFEPVRTVDDGFLSVDAVDGDLIIKVNNKGENYTLRIGKYNAWRLIMMLMFMLQIPIPRNFPKQK